MAEKMSARKELRQPDALQRAGGEARDWLQERQKAVGIAIVVVLLIGVAAAIASYFSQRGEERASKALGGALQVLDRPVAGAEAPAAPAAQGQDAPFPSQQAKDEEIVKSLTDFRAAHQGTRAANSAAFPLAHAQYRLGRYDDALATYEDFLQRAPSDDPLRASAFEGQGYAHEAKGDLDRALQAFEQMSRDTTGQFMVGMGLLHRARILEAQGKQDEAVKALQELQAAHPESAAARQAQERLAMLASRGVVIPEAAKPAVDGGG